MVVQQAGAVHPKGARHLLQYRQRRSLSSEAPVVQKPRYDPKRIVKAMGRYRDIPDEIVQIVDRAIPLGITKGSERIGEVRDGHSDGDDCET